MAREQPGGGLTQPVTELRSHYGVVVIGSGYGGAVVAARLAEAGVDVCVLERGRAWQPGEFPESQLAFAEATSLHFPRATVGRADALYRFQMGRHLSALTGSGLGGTSLINAGVLLRPTSTQLEHALPGAVLGPQLERAFERVERVLTPAIAPRHLATRLAVLERHQVHGRPHEPVPVAVTFEGRAGSPACTGCGNCITGCNVGAKGSLDRNYLPLAHRHGAELFTGIEVRRLVEHSRGMGLFLRPLRLGRERFEETELFLTADVVVVAAGALGSTELLCRSRDAGLPVSSKLGLRFSGNGTVLAFTDQLSAELEALANRSSLGPARVGPSLTGMFDLRGRQPSMLLQDTAVPRALVPFLRTALRTRGASLVAWSVTAGDDAGGRLELRHGRLRIEWPNASRTPRQREVDAALEEVSRQLGGRHHRNPTASLPGAPLITTHPLGGCAMGEVVDASHRVLRSDGGEPSPNLYVCDGSVFRGALGTNPLWTISALAERCAEKVLEAHPRLGRRRPRSQRVRREDAVRFTERMSGWLSRTAPARPAPASKPSDAVSLSFLLTVEWPSAAALAADPSVVARSLGTLRCSMLADEPLTVTGGQFQLFVETPEGTRMRHVLELRARDGTVFTLEGHKEIVDDPGPDLFFDTRTLFVRVSRHEDERRALVGHGVVQTGLVDLSKQVRTIAGVEQPLWSDLRTRASFLRTFLGRVRREYGGLLLPLVR
ncbi:MAG: GMC family oxidoreductase [Myxococcaceae bacterium]|nr:GMC family oxidoreductase [Myxococcaceae bacterium]